MDINPRYLATVQRRFAFGGSMDLYCVDLANQALEIEPVDLVHAALIFEHAGTARCLDNALAMMGPGGHLSVVLQRPGEAEHQIGPSEFVTVQKLGKDFALVNRDMFVGILGIRDCQLVREYTRRLPAGKAF